MKNFEENRNERKTFIYFISAQQKAMPCFHITDKAVVDKLGHSQYLS